MARNLIIRAAIPAALIAVGALSVSPAMATPHQDHRGACGTDTTSISRGVDDLVANGVAERFGAEFGIRPIDGPVVSRLKQQLMVGSVAQAVTTNNNGCDGNGSVFGAGSRTLFKGETVVIKRPAQYAKADVRSTPTRGFRPIVVRVGTALPTSCWNLNNQRVILVRIWVRKQVVSKVTVVRIRKIAEDASGHVLPATPTGTFRFRVTLKGKTPKIVVLNTNPQVVVTVKAGTKVTVK